MTTEQTTEQTTEIAAENSEQTADLQELLHHVLPQKSLTEVLNFIAMRSWQKAEDLVFPPELTKTEIRAILHAEQQELVHDRPKKCVYCGHEHLHSKGLLKDGRRRWLCTKCHRSFNDFTGTIFAYIHKINEMLQYLETDFFQGTAVRAAADKLAVDRRTTFAWRHKFGTALQKVLGYLPDDFVSVDDFAQKISLKGANHEPGQKYQNPKAHVEHLNGAQFVSGLVATDDGAHLNIQLISFGESVADSAGKRFLKRCVRAKKRVVVSEKSKMAVLGRAMGRGKRRVESGVSGGGALCEKWKNLANPREFYKVAQDWGMKFRGVATKYQNNYYATISWIATHFREPDWFKKLLRELLSNREALRKYFYLKNLKLE